jgi:putative sterol carrier protein
MTFDEIAATLKERALTKSPLGATVKLDFGADGQLFLDGTGAENVVAPSNGDADCTIAISLANFASIISGDLSATGAYMTGKMKISGDLTIAMKLSQLM